MSLKTCHGEKSAVIMMGIVIGVFVITYGMYLHCSFLILFDTTGMASCDDVKYKIPVLVPWLMLFSKETYLYKYVFKERTPS